MNILLILIIMVLLGAGIFLYIKKQVLGTILSAEGQAANSEQVLKQLAIAWIFLAILGVVVLFFNQKLLHLLYLALILLVSAILTSKLAKTIS